MVTLTPVGKKDGVKSFSLSAMGKVDPATNQPPGVPTFVPPGVEGYNPQTGMVEGGPSQAMSAGQGAADITTFGFGDELSAGLIAPFSDKTYPQVRDEIRGMQKGAQAENPGSFLGGQLGGGLAQALFTGPAAVGPTLGRTALGMAGEGAALLGLYGVGSGETAAERAVGGAVGAGLGAGIGALSPLVMGGAQSLGRRLLTPFATSPERQAAVATLSREGVPLTAGQRTGSKSLMATESELGGRKAADIAEDQGRAFTDAAMKRAGGSGLATPDNLAANKARLGNEFTAMSARNTLQADRVLAQDIQKTLGRYEKLLETQQKPIIRGIVKDVLDRVKSGSGRLSGEEYQTIRSDLSRAASSTTNQTLASAFRGVRNALDDAMDRSIPAAEKGKWRELRKQYGNQKVLQSASLGAGEDAGMGIISPARLRTAASTGNRDGFATGASDFTELAKAGQAAMTPLPNSGTPMRLRAQHLGMPIGLAGVGGGVGYSQDGLQGLLAGAGLGALTPKLAGSLLMSSVGQKYLGNQLLPETASPALRGLLSELLSGSARPIAISGD